MWDENLPLAILEHFDEAQRPDVGGRSARVAAGLPVDYWEHGLSTFARNPYQRRQYDRDPAQRRKYDRGYRERVTQELAPSRRAQALRGPAPVEGMHECPLCDVTFGLPGALTVHLRHSHADVGSVTCIDCRATFASVAELVRAHKPPPRKRGPRKRRDDDDRRATPLPIVEYITDLSWEQKEQLALTIECPVCESLPGVPCCIPNGHLGSHSHRRRSAFQQHTARGGDSS